MKTHHLTLLLALITVFQLKAFDFQSVYSNRVAFFNNENNLIVPIRIDSVKYQDNDSVFYPMRQILKSYDCYNPYAPSSLGEKIIVTPDYNYFFNVNGDTIKIHTSASLNETWVVYKSTLATVTATVDSVDTMNILGMTDSVKFCKLHAYDVTMSPLPNYLEGKYLILSKHYGLVKAYNFLMVPYLGISKYEITTDQFNLVGLTNPDLGVQNITWKSAFDFQPGDEVHTEYVSTDFFDSSNVYTTNILTIHKYLQRIENDDSIVYFVDQKIQNGSFILHDTVQFVVKSDLVFDHLSLEPIFQNGVVYCYTQFSDSFPRKIMPSAYNQYLYGGNDTCWTETPADGCFYVNEYYKGLGGSYYYCDSFTGHSEENKLIYYKKGDQTWGKPLVITDVNQPEIEKRISVYPNPATEILHFKMADMAGSVTIMINDLKGKLLLTKVLNSDDLSISLSGLDKGIYLYTAVLHDGHIYRGKFVKD